MNHQGPSRRGSIMASAMAPSDHPSDHAQEHVHEHHDQAHRGVRGAVASLLGHAHAPDTAHVDPLTADARAIRAVVVSLLVLGATAAVQLAIVAVSASVALLADTVHNVSDALTAVPLWIAFAVGRRATTRRYTFGYRRAEDLAGLVVLAAIAASAALAAWESITRLIEPQPVKNIPIVVLAGVVGFAGNEAVALYRIRVGRAIGSAALVADGYHARTDGFTSLAVVAGALGVAAGYPVADPLVGLLISAVILVVLRQASGHMLGRLMDAVDPDLVDRVEAVAAAVPGVQSIERSRVRWLGHGLEAYVTLTVDRDLTVAAGHDLAEEVRHRLLHEVPRLELAFIHVNPCGHDGTDAHALTRHHPDGPTSAEGAPVSGPAGRAPVAPSAERLPHQQPGERAAPEPGST